MPQPGPRARAAPLLPARPHLWPRRQPRRDSCISRSPPLGSRPRLAFSASRRPAAPPRHRAGPAAAATAATEGPRPSPAARPQRPAGADASAVLGKTPIRSRRPYRELVGRAPPRPGGPTFPGSIAEARPPGPSRREFESSRRGHGFPGARASAADPGGPLFPAARLVLGPWAQGVCATGATIGGVVTGRCRGEGTQGLGSLLLPGLRSPVPRFVWTPSQLRPGWGRRLNGDGEAGARAGS